MEIEISKQQTAMNLHARIMAEGSTAAQAMVDFARDLKEMRDEKLYLQLGVKTFEEYVEGQVGIRRTQAYTYIQVYERIGPQLMEQKAGVGIQKLSVLGQINAIERENVIKNNNVDEMTVKELQELRDKLNQKGEQLSLLSAELEELKAGQAEAEATEDTEEMQQQIAELQKKLDAAEKEQAEAVRSAKVAAKMDANKKLAEVERKLKEQKAATEKSVEEKVEEQKKQILAAAREEKEAAVQAERAAAEKLRKEMQLGADENSVRASVLFKRLQMDANELLITVSEAVAANPETGKKLAAGVKRALEIFEEKFGEME